MRWSEVEPVLKATYQLLDDAELIGPEQVAQALGKPPNDESVIRALAQLYEAGYIDGFTVQQSPAPIRIKASEKGLQEASGWPKPGAGAEQVELLLRLLDERINDDATPEEEKGRLRKARDGFASVSRDMAVELMSAYVAKVTGVGGGD